MSHIKTFTFQLNNNNTDANPNETINIQIREIFSTDYSNFVWPSALMLCDYICTNWRSFQSRTVIEIGSGTGLCAIVCAKIASNNTVYATDISSSSLTLCKENIVLNNATVDVFPLKWGSLCETLPKIDYIIGSDCFYNESDFEDILFTVSILLDNASDPKNAAFYLAYQLRSSSYSIECLVKKWKLTCRLIPFSSSQSLNSLPVIEIYKITKDFGSK